MIIKKNIIFLLITAMMLSSCGSRKLENTESTSEKVLSAKQGAGTFQTKSDINSIGSIDVDQELFTVTLNIPKDFVGDTTQEELDNISKEKGFHSIKLNNDGSATYIMTQVQHDQMMSEYRNQINDELSKLINSENYPNFTKIEANNDFTEFIITTKSKELDLTEAFSVMQFYVYSGLYNVFNGTEVDNISVIFKNAETGAIIHTENSNK